MNRNECYETLKRTCTNQLLEVVNNEKDGGTVYIKGIGNDKTRHIQIYFRPTKKSVLLSEKAKETISSIMTLPEQTNMIGSRYNFERVSDGFIMQVCDAFIQGYKI